MVRFVWNHSSARASDCGATPQNAPLLSAGSHDTSDWNSIRTRHHVGVGDVEGVPTNRLCLVEDTDRAYSVVGRDVVVVVVGNVVLDKE